MRTQIEELTEFFTKQIEKLSEERKAKEELVERIDDSNTHIAAVEYKQTLRIKNKRENTCVITNDNYKKVININ